MRAIPGVVVCVAILLAGLTVRAPAAVVSYPESPEGLAKLLEDTFASIKSGDTDRTRELIRSMELPDQQAWVRKTFGDDFGAAIAIEYGRRAPQLEAELTKSFEDCVAERRTFVKAIKIESSDDDNATGLQKTALQHMRLKVPLYTVKFGDRPGGTGYSMWSWVYVRGSFRIAGKMDVFRKPPAPVATPEPVAGPATAPAAAPAAAPTPMPSQAATPTPGPAAPATPAPAAAPDAAPIAMPSTTAAPDSVPIPGVAAAQPDAPASPAASALKKVFEELLAALQAGRDNEASAIVRSMMLPESEAWFAGTFGETNGKGLAENYLAELAAGLETQMLDDIRAQIAKGRTQVIAYKIEGADDPKAEERQRQAIGRMTQKYALYGVRLTEPGQVTGTHYRSFVYVDGKFRMVGKMEAPR
jgi:cell division septation protein DedD